MMRKWIGLLLVGLWTTTAAAQVDCPAIVRVALEATDAACAGAGRNQACYGNVNLNAIPLEGVPDFNFDAPGDIVDVAGVQMLRLEPLDEAGDTWGIALMRLQANIPDSLPGQNVTFLLFGDVEINNAVQSTAEPVTVEVVSSGDINVRGGPSTNDARIAGLAPGQSVTADGRNADGSCLRIVLEDGTSGWVSTQLVSTEDDITILNVVDSPQTTAESPVLSPMQAFYFRTGIDDALCEEAPDSGILIQTPEGVGQITLTVNEVTLQLGSTVYLQTLDDSQMAVNVVEHQASVSAQGVTRLVPAGSRVRVPLDANLAANGPPSPLEPYDNADLAVLPTGHMPRIVTVAAALTQAELDALSVSTLPVAGEWLYESTSASVSGNCPPDMPSTPPPSRVITLIVTEPFSAQNVLDAQLAASNATMTLSNAVLTNPEPNVYTGSWTAENTTFEMTVRFTSPTSAEGTTASTFEDCTFSTVFTLTAQ